MGHDTTTTADENLLSRPDPGVAQAAFSEGRMILTLDVEFGDLRKYPPGSHPGILLFRPKSLGPLKVNEYIESHIRNMDLGNLTGCTVIVEPLGCVSADRKEVRMARKWMKGPGCNSAITTNGSHDDAGVIPRYFREQTPYNVLV